MVSDPKDAEKKLGQLQLLEQSMQNLLMQKQQFQLQQVEIESALKELEKTKEAYKIVGNIMVLSKKEDLDKTRSAMSRRNFIYIIEGFFSPDWFMQLFSFRKFHSVTRTSPRWLFAMVGPTGNNAGVTNVYGD